MRSVEGISVKPLEILEISDILIDKARSTVPKKLKRLITLLTMSQDEFQDEEPLMNEEKTLVDDWDRFIVSQTEQKRCQSTRVYL